MKPRGSRGSNHLRGKLDGWLLQFAQKSRRCTDGDEVRPDFEECSSVVDMVLKLSDNPPSLLPIRNSVVDIPGEWYVAHCKSRLEKSFAHDLARLSVDYYLPLVPKTIFSGGRKRSVLHPLFPSYVFFAGTEESRLAALRTDRLANVLPVREQHALIKELSEVEKALSSGVAIDMYRHIALGQRCRIRSGPMQGVCGIVVQRDNLVTFVVEVTMLRQGAAMQVDGDLLEPVD